MTHLDADDTRALRRDGDWSRYLRSLIRPTTTTETTPKPTASYGPHHTPGAWPYGTHPATSLICQSQCGCAPQPPTT